MAPNPERLVQRVLDRIATSPYFLEIHYPMLKPVPSGTAPLTGVSPLIAVQNPGTIGSPAAPPVSSAPPVTLQCLYLDAAGLYQLRQTKVHITEGWDREVKALARVDAEPVDISPGNTIFDGCTFVVIDGQKYKFLGLSKVNASMSKMGTYYVLLGGGAKTV